MMKPHWLALLALAACASRAGYTLSAPRTSDYEPVAPAEDHRVGGLQPQFNPSVTEAGSPIPAFATLVGQKDDAGNTQPVSAQVPLPVAVLSGGGNNGSVANTGGAVPTQGTYLAGNQGGNLVGLPAGNAAAPIRVDPTGTTTEPVNVQNWVAVYNSPDGSPFNVAVASGTVTVAGGCAGAQPTWTPNQIVGVISTGGSYLCSAQLTNRAAGQNPYLCLQRAGVADASTPCAFVLTGVAQATASQAGIIANDDLFRSGGWYSDAGWAYCVSQSNTSPCVTTGEDAGSTDFLGAFN